MLFCMSFKTFISCFVTPLSCAETPCEFFEGWKFVGFSLVFGVYDIYWEMVVAVKKGVVSWICSAISVDSLSLRFLTCYMFSGV